MDNPSAIDIIEFRLNALIAERETNNRVLAEKQRRAIELDVQIATLTSLKNDIQPAAGQPQNGTVVGPFVIQHKADKKRGATDAVIQLLRESEQGIPKGEIAATLSDKIDSESGDPKRVIYNTLLNLRKRHIIGIVKEDGEERCVLIGEHRGR